MDPVKNTNPEPNEEPTSQGNTEQKKWTEEVENQLQNKEHQYKDKISKFFKAPVLPDELFIGPSDTKEVTLEPEHMTVVHEGVGEPLFAEPEKIPEPAVAAVLETKPTELLSFKDLVEQHIETGTLTTPEIVKEEEPVVETPAPVQEPGPIIEAIPVQYEPVIEQPAELTAEPIIETIPESIPEPVVETLIPEPTPKPTPEPELVIEKPVLEAPVEAPVVESVSEPLSGEVIETAPMVAPVVEEPSVEQGEHAESEINDVDLLHYFYSIFAEIDPQKALDKREYTAGELAKSEQAFHAYAETQRAASTDIEDPNEEFHMFTETFLIHEALKEMVRAESTTEDKQKLIQHITDDFFLFQDPRPIRYLLEYFIGVSTRPGQVEYYPYIDYRVMVKRPLLVCMMFELFFSMLPTESPALLLSIQDEIYQDRKKYVRFVFECSAHSKIQKRYMEIQPLLQKLMDTVRARFGMRILESKVQMVMDFSFTVKKDE